MPQLFSNGARGELVSPINSTDTTFTLVSGGELFPACNYANTSGAISQTNASNWIKVVLQDATGFEIVYVYMHAASTNVFSNLRRGQEGTAARSWDTGTVVGLRPIAGDLGDLVNSMKAAQDTLINKADKTGDITGNAATASKLQNPVAIGGVNFDGYTGINLPGVNEKGNQDTSGVADLAKGLQTAFNLTVGGTTKPVKGDAPVSFTLTEVGAAAVAHTHGNATTSTAGFMSGLDKEKLNNVEEWATNGRLSGIGINLVTQGKYNLNNATSGKILAVNGTVEDSFSYNWPNTGGDNTDQVWFNVLTMGNESNKTQIAHNPLLNRTWSRSFQGSWSEWNESSLSEDDRAKLDSVTGNASDGWVPRLIADSTDLNNYKVPGAYATTAVASQTSISNRPSLVTGPFGMDVIDIGGGRVKQKITAWLAASTIADPLMYFRWHDGTDWTAWVKELSPVRGNSYSATQTFTGGVTVPTRNEGENSIYAANTAFVTRAVAKGVASKANTSTVTDLTTRVTALETRSTYVYVSGDAANPGTVAVSGRYNIPNPYPGKRVMCVAEIRYTSEGVTYWGETGWAYASGGYGVKASQLISTNGATDVIIVQAGGVSLLGNALDTGNSFGATTALTVPTPCRVLVIRLD